MALTGRHFQIIAPGDSTFHQQFTRDPTTSEVLEAKGIALDTLNALAQTLNFTYDLTIDWQKKYGLRDENGTWSGIIGTLVNQEMDIAIGDLTQTYERSLVVDFFVPLVDHQLTFMIKKPRESNMKGAIRPFSTSLWALIGGVLCLTCLIYSIVNKSMRSPSRDNSTGAAILDVLQVYLYQGDPRMPTLKFGKFTYVGLWFASFSLYTAYSGNLVAYLATSLPLPYVDSFQKLLQDPSYKAGIYKSSSVTMLLKTATSGIMEEVWEKKVNASGVPIFFDGDKELLSVGISRVRSENFVIITTTEFTEWYGPAHCDLTRAKIGLFTRYRGFVARKGFPYMEEFNKEILHLLDSGLINEWKRKYLRKRYRSFSCLEENAVTPSPMSLDEVASTFLILGGGLVLASLILFMEMGLPSKRSYVVH